MRTQRGGEGVKKRRCNSKRESEEGKDKEAEL